jgi:hypothetical protein
LDDGGQHARDAHAIYGRSEKISSWRLRILHVGFEPHEDVTTRAPLNLT